MCTVFRIERKNTVNLLEVYNIYVFVLLHLRNIDNNLYRILIVRCYLRQHRTIPSPEIHCHRKWNGKKAHHVCAEGNLSVDRSSRWIWNFWNPFIPSKAPNPCKGTLLVPVTNWRNFARSAWSKERKALQNHWICDRVSKKSVIKGFTPGIRYPIGISHKLRS